MKIYILKQLVSYSVKRSATFFKTKQRILLPPAPGKGPLTAGISFDVNKLWTP